MPSDAAASWLSALLWLKSPASAEGYDQVILRVVEPIVAAAATCGLIQRWFFIRYSDGGPHIRLRMLPVNLAGAKSIVMHVGELSTRAAEWDGRSGGLDRLSWAEYEPEVERYGGNAGVQVAERHFHDSSCLALQLLRDAAQGGSVKRLGRALTAMTVAAHAFFPSRRAIARFTEMIGEDYLRWALPDEATRAIWLAEHTGRFEEQVGVLGVHVADTIERLERQLPITPAIDTYFVGLRRTQRELASLAEVGCLAINGHRRLPRGDAIGAIVPSYLHMTNNRLGLSIPDEAHLSLLLSKALATKCTEAGTDPRGTS